MPEELKKISVETSVTPTPMPTKKSFSPKFVLIPLGVVFVLLLVIGIMLLPLRGVIARAQDVAAIGRQTAESLKNQDLVNNKSEIMYLLGNEIVSRYYFQKGRAVNRMKYEDKVLQKAIETLSNEKTYSNILK